MKNSMVVLKFNMQEDRYYSDREVSIAERVQIIASDNGAIGVDADEIILGQEDLFMDAVLRKTGITYQFETRGAAENFYNAVLTHRSLFSLGGNKIPLVSAEVIPKIDVVIAAETQSMINSPVQSVFNYHAVVERAALENKGTLHGTAYDHVRVAVFNTQERAHHFKQAVDKIENTGLFDPVALIL